MGASRTHWRSPEKRGRTFKYQTFTYCVVVSATSGHCPCKPGSRSASSFAEDASLWWVSST